MTLREYLTSVMDTGGLNRVGTCIHKLYYTEYDSDQHVCDNYTEVIQELLQLRADDTLSKDNEICVKTYEVVCPNLKTGYEECVHVGIREISTDSRYSIDLVPWEQLINMHVYLECDIDLIELVSRILYEITFWGWSSEDIHREIAKTKQTMLELEDGAGELIEFDPHEFE